MLKELQDKAIKRAKTGVIIVAILLVLALIVGGNSFIKLIQGPKDISELSIDQLKGAYVDA